jgi:cephalosporin hydroxylase
MKWLKSLFSTNKSNNNDKNAIVAEYEKKYSMTLREWLINHQKNIVFSKCSWMGAKTLKNPLDTWIYQEIIYSVKPDVIVEIGSYAGGSTLYFANLLDIIGNGMVISVDIDRSNYSVSHNRIKEITGDSSSVEVFAQVETLCKDKTVLVMHDGGHEKEQVAKDLALYSKLVSRDSYLIVEDSIVDFFAEGDGLGTKYEGPLMAVIEFINTNKNFVIDDDAERYILTYNQRGFLKRIS